MAEVLHNGGGVRRLGRTGVETAPVALGALELGRDWAADVNPHGGHVHGGVEDARRLVDRCLELGVTLIDTAAAYWRSEEFLGEVLSGRRDRVVLATKFGEVWSPEGGSVYDYSPGAIRASVERSLRLLRTDSVDLLQVHSAKMEMFERGEVLETMNRLRDEGKCRWVGYSADVETAAAGLAFGGFDVVQVPFSVLNPAAAERVFPLAAEKGVGVLLMRSLAGGKLTKKYQSLADNGLRNGIARLEALAGELGIGGGEPGTDALAEMALRYAITPKAVSAALVGTRRPEAMAAAVAMAAKGPLGSEDVRRIDAIVAEMGLRAW